MLQTKSQTRTPAEIARLAADRYFDALAGGAHFDSAAREVSLIDACIEIQDALHPWNSDPDRVHTALHAGYLLGVEIGRRMRNGGA
jgi:hypothetical protein